MDRYLFDSFVFELDDEQMLESFVVFAKLSKNKVEREGNNKISFNYYPQDEDHLQLVVEGTKEKDKIGMNNLKVHHTSADVWKLKIINSLSTHEDYYMVSREDDSGMIIVRFVNDEVLEKIEKGTIIEAQVVGFAIAIDIFENEEAYENSVPKSKDGSKYLMGEGSLIPTNILANNLANLTEEERQQKDHSFDNLVDIKGTINNCYKYPLKIFDMDVNSYYTADVSTEYGNLKIIIPTPMMPEGLKGFGVGNVIVGKIMISGDVCINDYEKYASKINLTEKE